MDESVRLPPVHVSGLNPGVDTLICGLSLL